MLRVLAPALLLVLATGCSGDDDDSGSSEPVEISGTGYAYQAPTGYEEPEDLPDTRLDSVAAETDRGDDFADNINVLLSPNALEPGQFENSAVAELESNGFTDVAVGDSTDIDGVATPSISATGTRGDAGFTTVQYFPTYEDQSYVITFSFDSGRSEEERSEVVDQVLGSWQWSE